MKLNQTGTLSETIEAVEICHRAGWRAAEIAARAIGDKEHRAIKNIAKTSRGTLRGAESRQGI